ncbi:hypothetical protein Poly30_41170 [Planctomycetes bacterium Poly30]|uniref:HEAT repeat protein n=1 Tax=Saltatorellus ferox TaxID=2528018 RepID=A0A518EWW0_9BACT|nr:hypothetical protein Poly30_41170 [Planctomycetes bacterium Poly30]
MGKHAQRGPSAKRVCLWSALLILASPVHASARFAESAVEFPNGFTGGLRTAESNASPYVLDDAQRARIALLVDEISELDAAQLDAAAQQKTGAASADLVLAVLLRAGRPMPPGLSTARRTQRAERSKEALSWIRLSLTNPRRSELVTDAIASALDVASPAPELSVAAMRVVAQLDLVSHALEVARWLEEPGAVDAASDPLPPNDRAFDPLPRMRLSAQSALYQLYGRWFEDAAAFRAQWEILRGRTPDGTGRNELLEATNTAEQRALTLIEFAPTRLGHSLIDWPSPRMRANAARAIGRAVAAGTLAPAAARESLVEGLEKERSEEALSARLRTLLDLVQGADPKGEAVRSVRELVFDVAERAKSRSCEEIWVMIGALTRLAQPLGPEGDPARSETLALATQLFERAMRRGEVRALDPDALQGAITSMSDLVRSISNASVAMEAARPLAELVRPMVVGPEGMSRRAAIPLRVRRAAAEAFALSVQASDARELVTLVRSMETPELEYELLGALRAVIAVVEPGTANAEAVIDELFEAAAEPKFDSRARALELLLSEDVRPALLARPRKTESRWAQARLLAEPSPELQIRLAELLGLVGDKASLERLLDPGPPVASEEGTPPALAPLAQLASTSEELVAASAKLARALSVSSPTLRARSAYMIAGPGSLTEPSDALLPIRTREGLDLMLSVDVAALQPQVERTRALTWIILRALELRLVMPGPMSTYFSGPDPLALKLHDLSSQAGPSVAEKDQPSLALLRSLMRADLTRAAAEAGVTPTSAADQDRKLSEIMAGFDLALANAPVLGWTPSAITLESVSLLRALNKPDAALQRIERLISPETAPDLSAIPAPTIRLFTELVLAADPFSGRSRSRAQRSANLCMNLLQRPTWSTDSADVRLADLEGALQIASMLEGDDLEPELLAAVASASTSAVMREELEEVDAERAASVWKIVSTSGRR